MLLQAIAGMGISFVGAVLCMIYIYKRSRWKICYNIDTMAKKAYINDGGISVCL
jgi:hypothetical protein